MAAFEVTTHGRFWVTAEGLGFFHSQRVCGQYFPLWDKLPCVFD
jgi:hypothetical protein